MRFLRPLNHIGGVIAPHNIGMGKNFFSTAVLLPGPQPISAISAGSLFAIRIAKSTAGCVRSCWNFGYGFAFQSAIFKIPRFPAEFKPANGNTKANEARSSERASLIPTHSHSMVAVGLGEIS